MQKYFSIGEAAKAVRTTTETLRHYDRIGLIKPGRIDSWTHYRYYTQQDIVRIKSVKIVDEYRSFAEPLAIELAPHGFCPACI